MRNIVKTSSKTKRSVVNAAYNNGLRRCPCCNRQLIWKAVNRRGSKNPSNLATVDHIVPKSHGGPNIAGNYFVMCRKCNEVRADSCFVKFLTDSGYNAEEAKMIFMNAVECSKVFHWFCIEKNKKYSPVGFFAYQHIYSIAKYANSNGFKVSYV